jgi:hypothetical protein
MIQSLVVTNIPNLINGVSQQADPLKFATQADEQINGMSSIVEGLVKRNPTEHIKKVINSPLADAFVHFINRDPSEQYVFSVAGTSVRVFDLQGTEKTVNVLGTSIPSYFNSSSPKQEYRALTVADYTFILNTKKTALMSTTLAPAAAIQAVVTVARGAFEADYRVIINGTSISITSGNNNHLPHAATTTIAGQIRAALVANTGINTAFDISAVTNSSIHIKRKNGADFTIDVADSTGSNFNSTALDLVFKEEKTEADLPLVAFHGQKVRITDFSEDDESGYWVEFVAASGSGIGTGYWKETQTPSQAFKLNADTMPHVLIRLANGQFALSSCDGQTIAVGADTYTIPSWTQRKVGTNLSNPPPSFVGNTLNDICFFRNRLGFLSDENVILSETSGFFNFFRTDTTLLLDSDPIDVASSHTLVSVLRHAVPFSERLVLFADQAQFYLSAQDVLTPKTASIQQTTEFNALKDGKPLVVGKNIFFPFNRGAYSGIMEYYVTQDTLEFNAVDISASIPSYIKGNITYMTASSNEQICAFMCDENKNTLYIYKYFFTGDEKLQSSWSKWTIDSSANILGIEFLDNILYLLVSRSDGVFLEKMNIESGYTDTDSDFTIYLDRKITESGLTRTFDSALDQTTITLPYTISAANDDVEVTSRASTALNSTAGRVYPKVSQTSTTVVIKGNVTSVPLWIGINYSLFYKFARPMIRTGSGSGSSRVALTDGRFQLKTGSITFNKSLYFRVEVTPPYRDTYKYPYTGPRIGTGGSLINSLALQDGNFRFPIMSKNEGLSVTIVNDSPFPSSLMTADWEGFYVTRAQRI